MGTAVWPTTVAIVGSPAIGFLLALLLMVLVCRGCSCASRRTRSTIFSGTLQFVSASLYSLGHGGNDAQKTMGIIAVLLYSQGHLGGNFYVPFWVVHHLSDRHGAWVPWSAAGAS